MNIILAYIVMLILMAILVIIVMSNTGCPNCQSHDFDWWINQSGNKTILCEVCGWSEKA